MQAALLMTTALLAIALVPPASRGAPTPSAAIWAPQPQPPARLAGAATAVDEPAGAASPIDDADGPVAVSSTSLDPFAGCTADFPEFQPGTLYPNSEIEPSIAVNPTNEHNIVAAWQQDRWSNAASRGIVTAASFDGGDTWTTATDTHTSLCTGGTPTNGGAMFRVSNPWVSFGPDGIVYLVSLGIPFFNESAVLVSTSTDGGLSWSDPSVLESEANNAMNDKPTITADPTTANTAYAVWTRNLVPNEHASPIAAEHSAASRGPAWFSRTMNGGRTWEQARPIFDPGVHNGTIGHQIIVLPEDHFGGQLFDIFEVEYGRTNAHGFRGIHVASIRSSDKGATWSDVTLIDDALFTSTLDPLTGARVRTGVTLTDAAVDPGTGTLYAVWMDARFSGGEHNDIALSISTDGGLTWTPPTKANGTPTSTERANMQAFTPSVEVAGDGTVGISYYDLRNNGTDSDPSQPLETDRFLALCQQPSVSAQGCVSGWTEIRLTPSSFDLRVAPNSEGLFVGGYQGLARAGNHLVSLFAQANSATDPASVYFTVSP